MEERDLDKEAQEFTEEEMERDEWKAIHQPWALTDYAKKVRAYKALMDCDWHTLLLSSRGARELLAHSGDYSQMLADMKTDLFALEKWVYSGKGCGMQAMAVLSGDLRRRLRAPKKKPEVPPQSAKEAKDHATKLFKAKRWAPAADMYMDAIKLLDIARRVEVKLSLRGGNGGVKAPVALATKALPPNQEDEEIAPSLYANLAACRVRQHRWGEAVVACDMAIKLKPVYTKAILRRGQAKYRLRLFKEAVDDAERVIEVCGLEKDAELARTLQADANALKTHIEKELTEIAKDTKRAELEEKGIMLGEGDPIFGRDFDHILRRELRRTLTEPVIWIEELQTNKIGMCKVEEPVQVNGPEFLIEASVRARGAKRFLYFNIDIAVPWRGICYDQGSTPHWIHDTFNGIVRLYNITHYTPDTEWGAFVAEKPVDPKDIPTCTPGGYPLEPLVPLNPDGSVNTRPGKKHNEVQELIFTKYGPELAKKLKKSVDKAIEGLRDYLGEYRHLPEDELARQRMKEAEAEKVKQAAEDKAHMEEAAKEQEAFMIEHEKMLAEQERLRQMDEEPMEMHQVGNPPTPHVDGVLVN